jgi:hypothetical protein
MYLAKYGSVIANNADSSRISAKTENLRKRLNDY